MFAKGIKKVDEEDDLPPAVGCVGKKICDGRNLINPEVGGSIIYMYEVYSTIYSIHTC